MQRDGQLVMNRRGDLCLPDKIELKAGRVDGHADGFGFFIPDDKSGDMFLSEKEMHQVLHGDRVMCREHGLDRRGRKEGKIVEVLERANSRVVGRLYREHGHQWVVAENKRINQDIVIPPTESLQVGFGQVVTVEIVQQPSKHSPAMGQILDVLGNYADPGMEIEIALRKHDLPFEFSKEVAAQAKKLPKGVTKRDLEAGREDIRDLPLVTIDGDDSRDFDDAVYCEPMGRGFKLWVAIADVAHYVQPGSALDKEASERGNSVYFPRRVIPMLPEELSNGLCSLNPQVDRLCMVCEMEVASTGTIKKLPILFRRDAFQGAADLHPGLGLAERSQTGTRGQGPTFCRTCKTCTSCSMSCSRRAASAARSTSKRWKPRWCSTRSPARSRRSFLCPQRCSPDHRGVHAGGQCLRLGVPQEA